MITPDTAEYLAYEALRIGATPVVRISIGDTVIAQSDIEQAGTVTLEAPKAFDDLVAGDYSGLLLNNRQGAFDEFLAWTPAPLFSSNKSSFIFAGESWYGKLLKVELGFSKGGWFKDPFLEEGWFDEYTEFITLFIGKIKKWGPVNRAADQSGTAQPNTVEVYATDWIMDCLQKRIALPKADGTPNPLTFGEFLVKADPITGWSPAPIVREAKFFVADYVELDAVVESGGGAVSIITPGIVGAHALRATVTGASQEATGKITLDADGEMFVTGTMRIVAAPSVLADRNVQILRIQETSGDNMVTISVRDSGEIEARIKTSTYEQANFKILGYVGVPITFALWVEPVDHGHVKLWINNDEIIDYKYDISSENPQEFLLGVKTSIVSENWTIDYENIEIRTKYYNDAFLVTGGPFNSIGAVYVDNIAQLDTQIIDDGVAEEHHQYITRYEEWGIVQFTSDWWKFKVQGEVMFRVVMTPGGVHPLAIIENLLGWAGLTAYIDAPTLATAYAACPDDLVFARFDGGGERKVLGLKDIASMGMTVAEALKEISARLLYWIFMDAGKIKIIPYTGTPPAAPVMALTQSNLYEVAPIIDLETINSFVTATYGWYSRDVTLFYLAGTMEAGGQGTGVDWTFDSPVACEDRATVIRKADLLLKFLSAQERLEPVRMNLSGARLELMDVVSVSDVLLNDTPDNYLVTRKEIGLDPGSRETNLQLMRFLGE